MEQQTPTEVISRRVRELRDRRGMSAQALADRCAKLGMPALKRQAITNLENGRRGMVTIEELLVLAQALDVPPVLLFIPLDGRTRLQVTPNIDMASWQALFWVSGEDDPADRDSRQRWRETIGPVQQHRAFFTYFRRAARYEVGPPSRFNAEIRELARVLDAMISAGITPPAIPPEWRDLMQSQGWLEHPDEVPVQASED
ncbi:helix-turn-helix transcriptional regulator [Actinomadura miaoliensis]|uniref:HTH cro/C1-type domain-containing protein n=1 Tax=Actinomadura miaoliensis TaxID=430685 RepID=A0ABP7WX57_9ACTN